MDDSWLGLDPGLGEGNTDTKQMQGQNSDKAYQDALSLPYSVSPTLHPTAYAFKAELELQPPWPTGDTDVLCDSDPRLRRVDWNTTLCTVSNTLEYPRRDSVWTEEATLVHSDDLRCGDDEDGDIAPVDAHRYPETSQPRTDKCLDRGSTTSAWGLPSSLRAVTFLGTLGCGGYGKVLLARQSQSESCPGPHELRLSAVKVLQKKRMCSDDVHDLRRELTVLRTVLHEGRTRTARSQGVDLLQQMFSVVQDRTHVYITMEYHPITLAHPEMQSLVLLCPAAAPVLTVSKSLPIAFPSSLTIYTPSDEAVHALRLLAAELILGLLFLHSHGIVHQDIKPSNILVSSEGHAVITDFGSAHMLPVVESRVGGRGGLGFGAIVLAPHESVSYTPQYTAPELLGGYPVPLPDETLVYDARVDFFSLGVALRELATGRAPRLRACDGDACEVGWAEGLGEDDFVEFVDALLVGDPDARLHGPEAKVHPFFDPLSDMWDEIAALEYPPFPDPPRAAVHDDIGLNLLPLVPGNRKFCREVQRLFDDAAEIPWDSDDSGSLASSRSDIQADVSGNSASVLPVSEPSDVRPGSGRASRRTEALQVARPDAPSPIVARADEDCDNLECAELTRIAKAFGRDPSLAHCDVAPALFGCDARDGLCLSKKDPQLFGLSRPRSIPLRHRTGQGDLRGAFLAAEQTGLRGDLAGAAKHRSLAAYPTDRAGWTFEERITISILAAVVVHPKEDCQVAPTTGRGGIVGWEMIRRAKRLFRLRGRNTD